MAIPRSVWLVRHGQTDWNLARRYLSESDRPLTAYGLRQAAALGAFFATRKIDAIIHSGLARTEHVARAICGSRAIPVLGDARWRETSHGQWEGLTYREVMRRFPENAAQRFADPLDAAPMGGESLGALDTRVAEAWSALGDAFPAQRLVIVTHATPIQAILCHLTGVPLAEHWRWRADLGSATGVDCYASTTIVRAVNVMPVLR
jgi:alpha-ribazole phosphatase